jgi:hypothetical protein
VKRETIFEICFDSRQQPKKKTISTQKYFIIMCRYEIMESFRGQGYCTRALPMVCLPILKRHRIEKVIITCSPDNIASRKICERYCKYIETVDLPPGNDMYEAGTRQTARFEWSIAIEEEQSSEQINNSKQ